MKLSEILKDWPEKKEMVNLLTTREVQDPYYYGKDRGFNTALTSCDREIDKEALAKVIFQKVFNIDGSLTMKDADLISQTIISTMPTWLKRIEK